jgi:hypothetical protein
VKGAIWTPLGRRCNLVVGAKDGPLSFAASKRRFNYSTRHRVSHGAGPPTTHILHNRDPTICTRSYVKPHRTYRTPTKSSLVKAGYPPRPLTAVIPELPLSSLGIAPGDQLIVIQKSGSAASQSVPPSAPPLPIDQRAINQPVSLPPSSSSSGQVASPSSVVQSGGLDYVETEGGYLIHRVRVTAIFELVC